MRLSVRREVISAYAIKQIKHGKEMMYKTGRLSKITRGQRFFIGITVISIGILVFGGHYLSRRYTGWAGIRYEYYEDGKPKKKLTYGVGARLIPTD